MTKENKREIFLEYFTPILKQVDYKYHRLNLKEGDVIKFGVVRPRLVVKNGILKPEQSIDEFLDASTHIPITQLRGLTTQGAEDLFFKAWQTKCSIRHQKRINRIFGLIAVLLCWLAVLGFQCNFDFQSERVTPLTILGSGIIGLGMFAFVLWFKTSLEAIVSFIDYIVKDINTKILKTFKNLYEFFWEIEK